jgi:hypothetical protein
MATAKDRPKSPSISRQEWKDAMRLYHQNARALAAMERQEQRREKQTREGERREAMLDALHQVQQGKLHPALIHVLRDVRRVEDGRRSGSEKAAQRGPGSGKIKAEYARRLRITPNAQHKALCSEVAATLGLTASRVRHVVPSPR